MKDCECLKDPELAANFSDSQIRRIAALAAAMAERLRRHRRRAGRLPPRNPWPQLEDGMKGWTA
ncbi:MAG: hypothetical protein LBU32_26960 [Clostridiales bacterium]|jgi:hypothetical protein|nr:hypothetical protein [Clostridiales bacterium]